jgi:hypothetical protein
VIPYLAGALLGVAVAVLGRVTGFDRDRSFYSTVLVIVASYYVLFAILGDSLGALVGETAIAIIFSAVAIFGGLRFPLLVGVGIVGHGLFDLVHHVIIQNPGVPGWWPAFCMSIDVVLGLWVIRLSRFPRTDTIEMSPSLETKEAPHGQCGCD